jgi:CRP-like cAMP-binding protein
VRYRRIRAESQRRGVARELIGRLRFLADLTFVEREALIDEIALKRFRTGEFVVREDEAGDEFFIIAEGQAEVVQLDAGGWPRRLTVLRRGDYFGELALLYSQPRSASVRATTDLQLFTVGRTTFQTLVAPGLRNYGRTVQYLEERSELSRMPVFRHTAPAELEPLLDHLRVEYFAPGATVVCEGERGDRFYLIRTGRAEVAVRSADDTERVVRTLSVGDYFGEIALLNDSPRSATVRALEALSLWSLDRSGFEDLLLHQLDLRGTFAAESERRHASQTGLVAAA